jgi:DNA-binding NarL/FixJ family response regulator
MIVDDQELVRAGLRKLLEVQKDLEVVGEAASGSEALEKIPQVAPEVVLMDVRLGEESGIDVCRVVKTAYPQISVVILTVLGEEDAVTAAVLAGASGYLLKDFQREELARAMHAVARGESFLDPAVTKGVLLRLAATNRELAAANRQLAALNQVMQENLNLLFEKLRETIEEEQHALAGLTPEEAKTRLPMLLRILDNLINTSPSSG